MNEMSDQVKKKVRAQQIKWAFGVSAFVALSYSVTMFSWLGCEFRRLAPLMKSNIHVEGKVSASYRDDHCTCKYRFFVQNHEFEKTGRSCCDIPVDGKINVYYLESDPSQSTNFEPNSQFREDFWANIFGLFLMPSIAGFATYFRLKSKAIK